MSIRSYLCRRSPGHPLPRLRRDLSSGSGLTLFTIMALAGTTALQAGADAPQPAENPSAIKVYGGYPLTEWAAMIGQLDPASLHAAELVPGLIEIVQDSDAPEGARERAALTLGRIGRPAADAVGILARMLGDSAEPLARRVWAARALGRFAVESRTAAPQLIQFALDEEVPITYRQVPVEALARIGSAHPDVLPALMRLLQYQSPDLSRISSGDATILRGLAAEALAVVGRDAAVAAPLLIRIVRSPGEIESVRRKAMVALGALRENGGLAVNALLESLEFDDSPAARDAAAAALVAIGRPAEDRLRVYLRHPDAEVRWRIATSLGEARSPDPRTIAAVVDALSDSSESVSLGACETLFAWDVQRDRVARETIRHLESTDRSIRMRALRLLPELGPPRADELARLSELARDPRAPVRQIARLALRKVRTGQPSRRSVRRSAQPSR